MSVIFETSVGEFTIDLYIKERPRCCENFLKLCKMKYYNYTLFHSIQHQLVAQAGDPTGTGTGGHSIWQQINGETYFLNELKPKIKHRKSGLISMVNNGQNKHGSQFFITLSNNLDYLDGIHTVFGEISDGISIVDSLNNVYVDKANIPLREVRIYHTIILDDPFPDHPSLVFPEISPEPTERQLISNRIGAEEDINDDSGLTEEEKQEIEKMKEAKINAQILTVIGDIPDEDIKPPENVLFVCSLNPITTSEDLEVIFSQFGEILSCEVIRDYKTGNSLQYAFIEFENKKFCENAYYHMERVLIDDRRIHVDFSQSVSKQWKYYKDYQRQKKGNAGNQNEIVKVDEKIKKHRNSREKDKSRSVERKERRNRSNEKKPNERNRERSRSINRQDKSRERNRKSRSRDRNPKRVKSRSNDRNDSRATNRKQSEYNKRKDYSETDLGMRERHSRRSHSNGRSNRTERKRSQSHKRNKR